MTETENDEGLKNRKPAAEEKKTDGGGDKLTLSHTIGKDDSPVVGAIAILLFWGVGIIIGPLAPLMVLYMLLKLSWLKQVFTLAFIAVIVYPYRKKSADLYSPKFCRFALKMAGWFKGGATLWTSEEVSAKFQTSKDKGLLLCYHPHGMIPFGYTLNGALRGRAQIPDVAEPSFWKIGPKASGVYTPVLFKIPLLKWIFGACGCFMPATKAAMMVLFRSRRAFGIIPGGSEEAFVHENGEEHLYIKTCTNFIKSALQNGAPVGIVFTFGESDLYSSVSAVKPLNAWFLKKFGCVLPIFVGMPWCPLLPRREVGLNSVLGAVLDFPRLPSPSDEDVQKWLDTYCAELEKVYDEHKHKFGYGGRKLKFH